MVLTLLGKSSTRFQQVTFHIDSHFIFGFTSKSNNRSLILMEEIKGSHTLDVHYFHFYFQMNNTSSAAVISGHHHDIMTFGRFNMTGYPSGYDTWQVILISVVVVVIMAVIIIGNLLVIVSIFSEYGLQCVQNWFVASLAVSDLMLGIVVMPFSLSQEVVGYWLFGGFWCQV